MSELEENIFEPPIEVEVYLTPFRSCFAISCKESIVLSVISRAVPLGSSTSTVTVFEAEDGINTKPMNFTEKTETINNSMIVIIQSAL